MLIVGLIAMVHVVIFLEVLVRGDITVHEEVVVVLVILAVEVVVVAVEVAVEVVIVVLVVVEVYLLIHIWQSTLKINVSFDLSHQEHYDQTFHVLIGSLTHTCIIGHLYTMLVIYIFVIHEFIIVFYHIYCGENSIYDGFSLVNQHSHWNVLIFKISGHKFVAYN